MRQVPLTTARSRFQQYVTKCLRMLLSFSYHVLGQTGHSDVEVQVAGGSAGQRPQRGQPDGHYQARPVRYHVREPTSRRITPWTRLHCTCWLGSCCTPSAIRRLNGFWCSFQLVLLCVSHRNECIKLIRYSNIYHKIDNIKYILIQNLQLFGQVLNHII
jgi:hypothetical protein